MGMKDSNYQIVYRGETLTHYIPGGWVFFQRPKDCGGGYWLGRTYDDVFIIEYEQPTSLRAGLNFLIHLSNVESNSNDFDENLSLF